MAGKHKHPATATRANTPVAPEITKPMEIVEQVTWGRAGKAKLGNNLGAAFMVTFSPFWVYTNWTALSNHGGSLARAVSATFSQGLIHFEAADFPQPSTIAFLGYAAWLCWQTLLYVCLPGPKSFGQRTPGGNLLSYTTNGLLAWSVTHILYLAASMLGYLDPAIIAKNWDGLFVAVNVYGLLLSVVCQLKGHWAPTFLGDRKLSGSSVFDFWGGVELNPRIGKYFDLKFFHNGRPGIVAWTLIDLSWAAYQRETLGYVTSSMVVVLILQALYVVDFFWNEDWYLRTIDISHDHFGFMLAWGDTTFLPTFYTLQAQYLARYPNHLTLVQAVLVLTVGCMGYGIFRWANYQRDYVRSRDGNATLWGRQAQFIRVKYRTDDGKEHHSILLTSGWWGVCRHANYLADLILSAAMCATCGFNHVLPWSYFFFMSTFLYHRADRDEKRCRSKYGEKWEEYCQKVPYRIIPGVY